MINKHCDICLFLLHFHVILHFHIHYEIFYHVYMHTRGLFTLLTIRFTVYQTGGRITCRGRLGDIHLQGASFVRFVLLCG